MPLVRPISRPSPPFYLQARGRAVRFQIRRINHDGLRIGTFEGKPLHHPAKHARLAPSFPTVVERLVWPVYPWCISPAQAVAVDEDDPAQHSPLIHTRLAVAPGKIRHKPRRFLVC